MSVGKWGVIIGGLGSKQKQSNVFYFVTVICEIPDYPIGIFSTAKIAKTKPWNTALRSWNLFVMCLSPSSLSYGGQSRVAW